MYENENLSCALPHRIDNWHTIVWRQIIHKVNRLQGRIAKAVKEGRWGKVKALMYLISKSFYAKLLAVFRVTTNKGGKTPGVDNIVWLNHSPQMVESRVHRKLPIFPDKNEHGSRWNGDCLKKAVPTLERPKS